MEQGQAQQVIEKAIQIAGCTPTAFARKAGVSQNAVWKLLRGITKAIKIETAKKFEMAVEGRMSKLEFLGIEQGDCEEQPNGTEAKPRESTGHDPGNRTPGTHASQDGADATTINQQAA